MNYGNSTYGEFRTGICAICRDETQGGEIIAFMLDSRRGRRKGSQAQNSGLCGGNIWDTHFVDDPEWLFEAFNGQVRFRYV